MWKAGRMIFDLSCEAKDKPYSHNSTVSSLPLSLKFSGLILHLPIDLVPILMPSSSQGGRGRVFSGRRRKREEEECSLAQTSCGVCDCAYFHGRFLITSLNAVFPSVFASRKSVYLFQAQPERRSVFRSVISTKAYPSISLIF